VFTHYVWVVVGVGVPCAHVGVGVCLWVYLWVSVFACGYGGWGVDAR
jgi:hypothetical protein